MRTNQILPTIGAVIGALGLYAVIYLFLSEQVPNEAAKYFLYLIGAEAAVIYLLSVYTIVTNRRHGNQG